MSLELFAFLGMAVLVLAGGLGAVTAKNIAHAALFLLISLAGIAGVFILLVSEFLALVQILIYGGAVTIVLLFALMLTRVEDFSNVLDNAQRPIAAILAALVFGAMAAVFLTEPLPSQPLHRAGIESIGNALFTQWAIPFEVASLVLLVALIGAIIIARGSERGNE
jgi:NADH-quinone oxidoreductase subunit J